MITIGVTAVGSGVGQAVLRSLAVGGLDYRVIGMDLGPTNSGIHWTDRSYLVPPVTDLAPYRERLLEICRRESIDLLIPGLDPELPILAGLAEELAAIGCRALVSPANIIKLSVDKLAMRQWCAERGLPFVETATLTDARRDAASLVYPRIVKPRTGSASVGAHLVHTAAELLAEEDSDDWIVQRYLAPQTLGVASTDAHTGALDQSNEVSAQYLIGPSGDVLGRFVSVNRLKDGIPIEILPVTGESWANDGVAIVNALAAEGARGPINLQGRLTADGTLQFFELNARFTGITGIRAMMGYREVEAAVRAFEFGDEPSARDCLAFDDRFIGTRHVGDMIVDRRRVETLSTTREYSPGRDHAPLARVLVTGANGYIGASTVVRLLDSGITELHALVRTDASRDALLARHDDPRLRVLVADLLAPGLVLPEVDAVVHLAALRQPGPLLYETNVEGTRRLVTAARDAGARRFVHLSSQAVYGTSREPLWSEALAPMPETAYATSKWMSELVVSEAIAGDMEILILRAARAYGVGPEMRWSELPHAFAMQATAGEPLVLDADGSKRMDLVHVSDLARAIELALRAEVPQGQRTVVNVGGGHPVSLVDLATLYGAPITYREQVGAGRDFGLDIRRARALLGWSPEISLAAAVAELSRGAAEH